MCVCALLCDCVLVHVCVCVWGCVCVCVCVCVCECTCTCEHKYIDELVSVCSLVLCQCHFICYTNKPWKKLCNIKVWWTTNSKLQSHSARLWSHWKLYNLALCSTDFEDGEWAWKKTNNKQKQTKQNRKQEPFTKSSLGALQCTTDFTTEIRISIWLVRKRKKKRDWKRRKESNKGENKKTTKKTCRRWRQKKKKKKSQENQNEDSSFSCNNTTDPQPHILMHPSGLNLGKPKTLKTKHSPHKARTTNNDKNPPQPPCCSLWPR